MVEWKDVNYILLTIALASLLVIPFFLKLLDPRLEVFPSVILPSGASLVYKNDSIAFGTYELYANRNDTLYRLDAKEFMDPIPEWYLSHLAQSNFGLDKYRVEFDVFGLPFKLVNFNRFNYVELSHYKSFHKEKLNFLGYDDEILIYRNYAARPYDSIIKKLLVDERIYNLK